MQAWGEGSEEVFLNSTSSCPHTTQQKAQRGKGDFPGSHSKVVPAQPQTSWMFGGLPDRQVEGKEEQASVPSLLLSHREGVPSHSKLGTELRAMAEGWESSLLLVAELRTESSV